MDNLADGEALAGLSEMRIALPPGNDSLEQQDSETVLSFSPTNLTEREREKEERGVERATSERDMGGGGL